MEVIVSSAVTRTEDAQEAVAQKYWGNEAPSPASGVFINILYIHIIYINKL